MRTLTEFERYVIEQKGTERPFSGEYYLTKARGTYCCKRCDSPLYMSEHKFEAHCGWPAFDDEVPGAVARHPDADGHRVEIVCANCGAHLGHVFEGEHLTDKNVRHCVNSVSMIFKPREEPSSTSSANAPDVKLELATFGGGCFWCIEAVFAALTGVTKVVPGYAGGEAADASYNRVCSGLTGHAEVIQLSFDPQLITYEVLLEAFFLSHDPTSLNRQGNDVGPQYRSVIFVHDEEQAKVAAGIIAALEQARVYSKPVVTEISAYQGFYPAEDYHHDYYANHPEKPYCALVIQPKLEKVKQVLAHRLKT